MENHLLDFLEINSDSLIIDDNKNDNLIKLTLEERLQKFIFSGDFREIKTRYVNGKVVNEPNL